MFLKGALCGVVYMVLLRYKSLVATFLHSAEGHSNCDWERLWSWHFIWCNFSAD